MLKQILHEIESASEPLDIAELSRKLGVERSALEGMIQFWVRKGRLRDDAVPRGAGTPDCSAIACSRSCPGPENCPFVAKMPHTYSLDTRPSTSDEEN